MRSAVSQQSRNTVGEAESFQSQRVFARYSASQSDSDGRWQILDLLRAIGALLVFFYHYVGITADTTSDSALWEQVEWLALRSGSLGTNLLLLLCGFLVAMSVSKPTFRYSVFLQRRALRIYLPYVLVLLLGLCFALLFPHLAKPIPFAELPRYLLEQLLLLPGLFPNRPFLTVSWTLSYIVSGYLLLPLTAMLAKRYGRSRSFAWCGCFLFALLCNVIFGFPSLRACYIPAGCLLWESYSGKYLAKAPRVRLRWLALLAALAIAGRIGLDAGGLENWVAPTVRPLLFFFCGLTGLLTILRIAIIAARRYTIPDDKQPMKWLLMLGKRGYSFYLLHGSVTKITVLILAAAFPAHFGHWYSNLPTLLFGLALSVLCTELMFRFVEMPCVRWLRRNEATLSSSATTSANA